MYADVLRPTATALRFSMEADDVAAIVQRDDFFVLHRGDVCRVDNELVRVLDFRLADGGLVAIVDLTRGFARTSRTSHLAATRVDLIGVAP